MDEKLIEFRKKAKNDGEPILRDESLELLLSIAKDIDAINILEIGTNVGLSGISLLLQNKNAHLTGIEIDEEKLKIASKNYKEFGVDKRSRIFWGDAGEILPLLSGEFDLIFLDGPKGHYFEYLESIMSILKVGGVLVADDVYFHGYVLGKAPKKHATIKHSLENFINAVKTDKRLQTEIIDIEDGISISKRIK